MAIKILNLIDTSDYICFADRKADDPTVFKIGALDSRIVGMIRDKATSVNVDTRNPNDEVETTIKNSQVNFEIVQYGLKGCTHLLDEKGSEISFKTVSRSNGGKTYQIVDPEFLKLLPIDVISELAIAIQNQNQPSEEELKK